MLYQQLGLTLCIFSLSYSNIISVNFADESGDQYCVINKKKGPAVWVRNLAHKKCETLNCKRLNPDNTQVKRKPDGAKN